MYVPPIDDIQFWVKAAIVFAIAMVGAFDLALLARYGPSGTISVVIRQWGESFPMLPYIIAFGAGAFVYHITYR